MIFQIWQYLEIKPSYSKGKIICTIYTSIILFSSDSLGSHLKQILRLGVNALRIN